MSRSQRIVWLLEECQGIDYDIKIYKRGKDMLAPKSLKEVHPLGKSPVISIQAPALSEPLVMAESGAMMEYLCDHFAPHLVPKRYQEGKEGQVGGETEQWLRYRFYMHYAEGSLMTLLVIALFMDRRLKTLSEGRFSRTLMPDQKSGMHRCLSLSNRLLEGSPVASKPCT